jgi:APA family basic amino acid/polyamine antiporter
MAGALAGYAFVSGKIASAGAAALAVGAYAWPDQQRLVAIAALVIATVIDLLGIARMRRRPHGWSPHCSRYWDWSSWPA